MSKLPVFIKAIITALLVLLAEHHLLTDQLVWGLGQHLGRVVKPTPATPADIVIVRLDNAVIADKRRNPYPRSVLLDVFKAVQRTNPDAVGLDIFLDATTAELDPAVSKQLAQQMAAMGNVVAAVRHENGHLVGLSDTYKGSVAATGVADIAYIEGQPVRAIETAVEEKASLAAALVQVARGEHVGHGKWPEEVPLNLALPLDAMITHVDASRLIKSGGLPISKRPGKPLIVLVAPYDDFSSDTFAMCLDGTTYEDIHGGDIHAIAVATLLQPALPFEWPEWPHGYILWLLGMAGTFLVFPKLHHKWHKKAPLAVVVGVLLIAGVVAVFASFGSLLPIGLPVAGMLLGMHLAESSGKPPEEKTNPQHDAEKLSESPHQTPPDA